MLKITLEGSPHEIRGLFDPSFNLPVTCQQEEPSEESAPSENRFTPEPTVPEKPTVNKSIGATVKRNINEAELFELYNSGEMSVKQLADKYGCSQATIHNRLTKIQKEIMS